MLLTIGDMIARFIDALVRGSTAAWLGTGGLWLMTAAVVLAHRRGARSSGLHVLSLLSLTSVIAFVGLCVATAVAIPRLQWVTSTGDPLVITRGDTWRRLRGPSVVVANGADVDLAVPTIDSAGRWVLFGVLSNQAIPGLDEAPSSPKVAGSIRLCATEGDACRAWPASWPSPIQSSPTAAVSWAEAGDPLSAIAFDVESGKYLASLGALIGDAPALEIMGRVSNDPPRDSFSSLFVVRRVASGRLQAARVISTPNGESYTFQLQRSDVSLAAGPVALRVVARPLLTAIAFSFPIGLIAYLLAPTLLARMTRRRGGAKEGLDHASVERGPDPSLWMLDRLGPLALSAAGAAMAAPGLVALASLIGAR